MTTTAPSPAATAAPTSANQARTSTAIRVEIEAAEREHRLALSAHRELVSAASLAHAQSPSAVLEHDTRLADVGATMRHHAARVGQLQQELGDAERREAEVRADAAASAAATLHARVLALRQERATHEAAARALDVTIRETEFDLAHANKVLREAHRPEVLL